MSPWLTISRAPVAASNKQLTMARAEQTSRWEKRLSYERNLSYGLFLRSYVNKQKDVTRWASNVDYTPTTVSYPK